MESEEEIPEVPQIRYPIDHPKFPAAVFSQYSKRRKAAFSKCADNIKRVCAEEYDDISKRVDRSHIQDSTSVRNNARTRRLANLLINDKGELNVEMLPKVELCIKKTLYSLGPDRQNDSRRQEHILKVLQTLQTNPQVVRLLRSIGKPHQHPIAEHIIKDTLQLPPSATVTDAHTRRAALAAWMCFLRQNVGSCFATAPAILVHDEQPEVFLNDLNELLNTGRLKRTFGGIESAVPLSMSWGAGELRRPILLLDEPKKDAENLALSPGLAAAFQAIRMIDSKHPLNEKIDSLQTIIEPIIAEIPDTHYFRWITPEDIIKKVILGELHLTEKDLEEYAQRPRGMIHESLLMHMPKSTKRTGGKGEACGLFYVMFEAAKSAFKGIADNALLKSWEFTLASFADTKADFTRWNLYSSLGLSPDQKNGLGYVLYEKIKQKLDHANRIVSDRQVEYEQVYAQVKFIEGRMKSASTEKEINWLRVEYQSRMHEFYMLEELRDKANSRAHRYSNLINDMVRKFDTLFPKFFQEVYDADMRDVGFGIYDDSPAGFRLLFKHGRSNTSQWTLIKTPQEYTEALSSFFVAIEPELKAMEGYEPIAEDISDLVTALVSHVKTNEFLESSFHRMALAHNAPLIKDPLKNMDKIEKKPWAYTSGGGMDSLVSSYFCLPQKPSQSSRWVENEVELLVFFVDILKHLPPKMLEDYVQNPEKSFLMYSPTHAFLLKPGISPLKEAWQSETFTYTWTRDELIKPVEIFWDHQFIEEGGQEFLIERLTSKIPPNYQPRFKTVFAHPSGRKTPYEFKNYIIDIMDHDRGLKSGGRIVLNPDEIDSLLFEALPLVHRAELHSKLHTLIENLPELDEELKHKALSELNTLTDANRTHDWMTAKNLQDICKAIIMMAADTTSMPINIPKLILTKAQQLGFAPPQSILFADTNWTRDMFAFVVNPGTGMLELWRVDVLGSTGSPMSMWKEWLNGTRRDIPWGVYTRPYEYKLSLKIL